MLIESLYSPNRLLPKHSLYHFHCLLGNSTTIEGWEKDKVATLVRRGEIREVLPSNISRTRMFTVVLLQVKFPYVSTSHGDLSLSRTDSTCQ